MKIALLTDTHFGARNDNHAFTNYFIKFFDEVFFPYLKQNNITKVIHLGDVFDRRKYVNFHTLSTWRTKFFDVLQSEGIQMDIIIGNHDTYFKNTNNINSPNELLGEYTNLKIYSEAEVVDIHGTPILYIPWVNPENEIITKQLISTCQADIAMGHLAIKGFEHFRGHINTEEGFEQEDVSKFDMVFTGHFHHKSSSGNTHYLGSPYEMVWTDYNDPRGFHTFDVSTRELEFIKNPNQIFIKNVYDDETNDMSKPELPSYEGKIVRVVVEKKTNPYTFERYIEAIHKSNPVDVSIIEVIVEETESTEDAVDQTKDTLTLLTDYVESCNIDVSKTDLKELIRNLYNEAINLEHDSEL